MKKKISLLLAMLLILVCPMNVHATPTGSTSLANLSDAEILSFLKEYNVQIPGGDVNYDYWNDFIRLTIANVEETGYDNSFYNWTTAIVFSDQIETAVQAHLGINPDYLINTYSTTATLEHSRCSAIWNDDYLDYNCYGYALGKTEMYENIGFTQNIYYTQFTMPAIEELVGYLEDDLSSTELNYQCIRTTTTELTASDVPSNANIICLRSGKYDFHFMKLNGVTWWHKPGHSIPLIWNYTSPNAVIWTNEGVDFSGIHEGTKTYDSTIYYFSIRANHNYTSSYAGEHYHSGTQHYYKMKSLCDNCGVFDSYYWTSIPCNGPPCLLQYSSVPDLDVLTAE